MALTSRQINQQFTTSSPALMKVVYICSLICFTNTSKTLLLVVKPCYSAANNCAMASTGNSLATA